LLAIIPSSVYNIGMYTVKEAAEKLGLDESHIRRLLIEGKIKGKKWGRDWMVEELNYERKRKPKRKLK
jgi:excisionase family DNA binding protein